MAVNTLRISHSDFCELNCGYCKITHSKSITTHTWPSDLPEAKNLVLPCNSFYREDLHAFLDSCPEKLKNISIELHFLTLSKERNQEKLIQLSEHRAKWIVHIDHLDHDRLRLLQRWDHQIAEYRVLPSKLYPAIAFLKDLPVFIQRKLKWIFANSNNVTADLYEIDEVALLVEELSRFPLHVFQTAETHWEQTTDKSAPEFITGDHWSVIDASAYQQADWPIFLNFGSKSTMYLGYVFTPQIDFLNSVVISKTASVLYLETPEDSQRALRSYAPRAPFLFLLENFLVRKEIWQVYLRTYNIYNHWTWSDFIIKENIQVQKILAQKNTRLPSNTKLRRLQSQAREHYLQSLSASFYEEHVYLLSANSRFRKLFFSLFCLLFSLKNLLPASVVKATNLVLIKSRRAAEDVAHSASMIFYNARKLILFILHKGFWSTHAKYWQSFSVANKTTGFLYSAVVRTYWTLIRFSGAVQACSGLYTAFGFIESLFEFPADYKHFPFPKRLRAQSLFVARKWVWLFLKMIGRR